MRLAAVAFTALAGLVFVGSPATRVYRDPVYGFVMRYPKTFRVESFVHANPNQTLAGAAFGTVRDPARFASPDAKPPPRAVVLLVEHSAGGPPPVYPVAGQDTKLPLNRAAFRPEGPGALVALVVGNGWNLWLRVWLGPHAPRADRDAVWRMVGSFRMRALRPGETTGEAQYLVEGQAAAYPVGSVTTFGSVFLVHAPHGFYSLRASCDLSVTLPVAFSCPDGRHWDRMGRPLWAGATGQDALPFAPTAVAGDGHVLVAEYAETGGNVDELERQLWG